MARQSRIFVVRTVTVYSHLLIELDRVALDADGTRGRSVLVIYASRVFSEGRSLAANVAVSVRALLSATMLLA